MQTKTYRQTDRRTEGRTDGERRDKDNSHFRNFTNGAKIHSVKVDIFSVVSSMPGESQTFGVSNDLHCGWPTLSCTPASLSVSLTYTKRCGKPDG